MDKLSNKLRLVRSQSMGVGVGGAGDKAPAHMMRRNTGSSSESGGGGRQASVVLLDERRLEVLVQPRLYAGELLDLVASHCHLREKEYFGLAVADDAGHFTWLQLDRRVLEHDLPRRPAQLTVHFLVKFFIESIANLAENRTVEHFYLQARSLIFRGTLEVESDIVFQLAALALQASSGDFADDVTTRALIKKSPVLPASVLKEHPSLSYCEDQVIEHYKKMRGQTRGQAVVNYMTIVESMPTYGVHYFEVYDKRQTPWWLGLSCRGIAQYAHSDRKVPVRVFPWKQLENLYFRDKKFSIEVHDAKRVVQTLSSFNLYEDALKLDTASGGGAGGASGGGAKDEELVDAIADSTTQVSVSRRSFNPGSIHVYVWFGKTQGLTKCIWQSAISQHQFYLDRKQAKMRHHPLRSLKEIARDLTRSSASLSSASSLSNLSRSGSALSLALAGGGSIGGAQTGGGAVGGAAEASGGGAEGGGASSNNNSAEQEQQQSEESKRAKMEMVAALKARREALEAKLQEKQALLKDLCIKEGELTGELPPETPLAPGEPLPQIRRRVGTEFALSENHLQPKKAAQTKEEELLANLELEHEIQTNITSAALKLASDAGAPKSVRKQRKSSYQQSQRKLKEIEAKINALKYFGSTSKNRRNKQPRPGEESDLASHADAVSLSPNPARPGEDSLRKGLSVPDLETVLRPLPGHLHQYQQHQQHLHGRHQAGGDNHSESPSSLDGEDEADGGAGARSCPSSPRKHPAGQMRNQMDTVSLEANSPSRMPRVPAGYIPSSVYLRSSYRSKQFPTLSASSTTNGPLPPAPLLATAAEIGGGASPSSSTTNKGPRSATLPSSPFRNKYEGHLTQCDSPVGLYNIPQQRTSQAFSSLDDIDALTAAAAAAASAGGGKDAGVGGQQPFRHQQHYSLQQRPLPPKPGQLHQQQQQHFRTGGRMSSNSHMRAQSSASHLPFPTVRLEAAAAANAYPSLERSSTKKKAAMPPPQYNPAMANRELPALPSSSSSSSSLLHRKPGLEAARSMEDLETLEAAGIHGRSKMQYREVNGGSLAGDVQSSSSSLADAMILQAAAAAAAGSSAASGASSLTHRLRSADEYPPHHSPGSAALPPPSAAAAVAAAAAAARLTAATSGHNIIGIRPLDAGGTYPTPLRPSTATATTNATLLPGQTYPEPSAKPVSAIPSLQEVYFHHHHHHQVQARAATVGLPATNKRTTTTVETTFGLNDTIRTVSKDKEDKEEEDATPPPPLFPKQYHQVVEQRRRSVGSVVASSPSSNSNSLGLPVPPRSIVSESPAVNRRVKPLVTTSPAAPPLPPTPSSSVSSGQRLASSADHPPPPSTTPPPSTASTPSTPSRATTTTVASSGLSSPGSANSISAAGAGGGPVPTTEIVPGKFVAYRESSKPFEMSDFYKYSTKYRKASASSSTGVVGERDGSNSGAGSDSSPRSSTASGGGLSNGSGGERVASAAPPPPPPASSSGATDSPKRPSAPKPPLSSAEGAAAGASAASSGGDLGDDFSNEMLAWYNSTQEKVGKPGGGAGSGGGSNNKKQPPPPPPGKPATLV